MDIYFFETALEAGTVNNVSAESGDGSISEATTDQKLSGRPLTPFLKYGDTVRIEVLDEHQKSIFGAIETRIDPHKI